MACERFLRGGIDTMLYYCALDRWLVEDKLEQLCQVSVGMSCSLVFIAAEIEGYVISELVNQKGVVLFENIDKPSNPLVPLNWKGLTEILFASQAVTAQI